MSLLRGYSLILLISIRRNLKVHECVLQAVVGIQIEDICRFQFYSPIHLVERVKAISSELWALLMLEDCWFVVWFVLMFSSQAPQTAAVSQ